MIDRIRRDILANRIHALIAGDLSNYGFETELDDAGLSMLARPKRYADRVLGPMLECAWCLYSDTSEYKLVGRYRPFTDQRREVLRWILFLHSDREYEWPDYRFINPTLYARGCLMTLLTFGQWGRQQFEDFKLAGDFDVWPFLRRHDFEQAHAASCPLMRTSR